MIKLCVLGSGSNGNATFVGLDGYNILLDAGFSYKELQRRLSLIGVDMCCIRSVFVSHEHSDHVQAVKQIEKKHGDITVTNGYRFESISLCHKENNLIRVIPFRLSHDLPCCGFDIRYKDFKLTYISDTGCVTEDAVKALLDISEVQNHVVVIECNYDLKMLTEGRYESKLKKRVLSSIGHMDNTETARILKEIRHDNLRLVLPFHLSTENNNPKLVQYEIKSAVGRGISVVCTAQDRQTGVFYYI